MNNIMAPILAILMLEAGARIAYTVKDNYTFATKPDVDYIYSPTVGWTNKPGFRGAGYCGNWREFDDRGFFSLDSPQVTDNTKKKLVFLGDSNTYGYCNESGSTFVEKLDRLLPEASSINLGISGYTSYQGYKTLLEVGESLQPDIIIVSFNYNDRRYVLDESDADSDKVFENSFMAHKRQELLQKLKTSYLVRAISFFLETANIVKQNHPEIPKTRLDALYPRVSLENYRRNLANIVHWANAHNSQVIFMLLGDNPVQTAALRKAIELLENGEYDLAINQLKLLLRTPSFKENHKELARIYLAEAYSHVDMPNKAEQVIMIKPYQSLHGGKPIRLDTEYHDVMRQVGAKYQVTVLDAREVLSPEDYIDMCHFDVNGHEKVARMLYKAIYNTLPDT